MQPKVNGEKEDGRGETEALQSVLYLELLSSHTLTLLPKVRFMENEHLKV